MRTNHLESAQLAFEQTLRLAPSYPAAHQKLALVALKQDRHDDARQHLQKELALDRYFEHEPTAEEFGQLLLDARMPQHAAVLFARLLELRPRDALLCHQMAKALFMADRLEEGIVVEPCGLTRSTKPPLTIWCWRTCNWGACAGPASG